MCSVIKDLPSVLLFIAMCQLYLHLFSASGTFDPEDSGTVTCQIEQSAVGATRAMYSYCFSVGCSFFDVHHFSRSSFTNICSFLIFSIIQTYVRFCNSKFSLRQLSNLPRSCYTEPISVCLFQSWGRLIFFRKGFIYEAYQKYRSAPCWGDPLHYAVSLLRSVRAAMAVAYSHPHTSDSWR